MVSLRQVGSFLRSLGRCKLVWVVQLGADTMSDIFHWRALHLVV